MSYAAFSPKQKRVLSWWVPGNRDCSREAIVCDGAVRSGKTMAMGLSFFLWACVSFENQRFGVCGKTISSLRRNVLSEILPRLEGLGATWKEKRTENLVIVRFLGRENRFYVFGGRDESSASRRVTSRCRISPARIRSFRDFSPLVSFITSLPFTPQPENKKSCTKTCNFEKER